jgi:DNA-binding NarL/FixJ family response regulator
LVGRILIADNDSEARKTIRTVLASASIEICGEAENGRDAVEQVRRLKPDLVIVDVYMPETTGPQAAYEIRRIAPSTKIVFFSVHRPPRSSITTRVLAGDAFVHKSDPAQLLREVKRLLQLES